MQNFVKVGDMLDVKTVVCCKCNKDIEILEKFAPAGDYICAECTPVECEPNEYNEAREKEHKILKALRESGYRKRNLVQTFDNFVPPNAKAKAIVDNIKQYKPSSGKWLFMIGKTGTGKDHLACAIGRQYLEANARHTVLAGTMQSITRIYRDNAFGEYRNETGAFDDIARVGLLIIRDAGVKTLTDAERGLIVDVLDARYDENLPVIVTGNFAPDSMSKVFDERVTDRLREVAYYINGSPVATCDWESYRREGKI